MRLFIEAVLDDGALDAAWAAGRQLAADGLCPADQIRWVRRGAFHLTLRFLGEVDEAAAPAIGESLTALSGTGRIALALDRVGSFGGRRPRVIWVGVAPGEGLARLTALRGALDAALAPLGLEPERGAFRPHLTVGRVRRQASRAERAQIGAAVERVGPLRIRASAAQVALVHSTLLTDGPRYRRLAFADL